MIEFMSKEFSDACPLIASSCLSTERAETVLYLARHGVRGAILKSCADYTRRKYEGKRAFERDEHGYVYASSPFEKEILTLKEALALMSKLRGETDMLLIPSFTASTLRPADWLAPCELLAESGADGIQLDFFYMSNLLGEADFCGKFVALLSELTRKLPVPVMPKLNINLPKDFVMPLLVRAGVEYVSLLDSVRSPYIEQKDGRYTVSDLLNAETTSCFGGWQLPLTLGYTHTAARYGLKVCAGGGVTCPDDIRKLRAAGAVTVQAATHLMSLAQKCLCT